MKILAVWKDCEYTFGDSQREEITSYWIAVENEKLDSILHYFEDQTAFLEQVTSYRGYSKEYFYLFVSKNLKSIVPMFEHYPYSSMWNAYNPFIAVRPVEIDTLEDVLTIDEASLEPIDVDYLSHYLGDTKDNTNTT